MKRIRYRGKTLKQDETDQKIWNMLVQNRMKRNETMKHTSFFFYKPISVTLFRNEHISNCLVGYILFQSFSSISYSFHLLRNRNGFIKKKDVCFIVSFHFILFCNEHISNCLVCYILFQSFSSISYLFHLLRNRNGFIKKSCMFHRFIPFRNEHISNFLVCFILFQSFSYISYSFHLLRNRNGFIKKKRCMFHCYILFHPVS